MWLAETRCGVLKPTIWANEIRSRQNREPPIPSPNTKNKVIADRGYYLSVMPKFVLICLRYIKLFAAMLCFTPQNWILPHVIRNDFAGIHVTVVQFTSLLCEIRANHYV